jgi:hypothetical protein
MRRAAVALLPGRVNPAWPETRSLHPYRALRGHTQRAVRAQRARQVLRSLRP